MDSALNSAPREMAVRLDLLSCRLSVAMNPEADKERISKQQAVMAEEVDCLARIARGRIGLGR